MELAFQDLTEKKVMVSMAKERDLSADMDYETIKSDYESDAGVRSERDTQEQTVYGPDSLSLSAYYGYRYTSLRSELEEALKSEYTLSEDKLRELYSQYSDQYTYQTQVSVTVCEMKAEEAECYGENAIRIAMESDSIEELKQQFPEAGIYEITMNDLNMQEGKSGVYAPRWEAASQLQEGEVSPTVQVEENILVMKCTDRQENGRLDFENVKGLLESQYQTEKARQEIEKKTEEADVEYQEKEIRNAALELLEK